MKTRKRSAALIGAGAALLPALAVGGTALAGTAGANTAYAGNAVSGPLGACPTYNPTDGISTTVSNVGSSMIGNTSITRKYSPSARCIMFTANYYLFDGGAYPPNGQLNLTGNGGNGRVEMTLSNGNNTMKTGWMNDANIQIGGEAQFVTDAQIAAKSSVAPY